MRIKRYIIHIILLLFGCFWLTGCQTMEETAVYENYEEDTV